MSHNSCGERTRVVYAEPPVLPAQLSVPALLLPQLWLLLLPLRPSYPQGLHYLAFLFGTAVVVASCLRFLMSLEMCRLLSQVFAVVPAHAWRPRLQPF